MEFFDGRGLAEEIYQGVRAQMNERHLSLGIIQVGHTVASEKFIEQKKKKGSELGVDVRVYHPVATSSRTLRREIADLVRQTELDGYVIQLPLPERLNTQYILNSIPEAKDIDVLGQKAIGAVAVGRATILPPVVAAIKKLLESINFSFEGKKIVVVGAGRLVGRPVTLWLISQNIPVTVITEHSPPEAERDIREADLIISGVGSAHLISGENIQDGAVVIDAGTSEKNGTLVGDIDPAGLKSKSGWFSPVPGGIGPLTVAYIFKNLVTLAS